MKVKEQARRLEGDICDLADRLALAMDKAGEFFDSLIIDSEASEAASSAAWYARGGNDISAVIRELQDIQRDPPDEPVI